MIKRHQDLIDNAMENLLHQPVVRLSKRQVKYWTGSERARNTFWRALAERLPEGIAAENVSVLEEDDDIYLRHRNGNKWRSLKDMG